MYILQHARIHILYMYILQHARIHILYMYILQHARRRAHDIQGTMTYEDSGIWLIPFDYNNNRQLIAAMPRLQEAEKVQCHLGPYCGVPFIIPVIDMLHPK
jgi:hypothetical protein